MRISPAHLNFIFPLSRLRPSDWNTRQLISTHEMSRSNSGKTCRHQELTCSYPHAPKQMRLVTGLFAIISQYVHFRLMNAGSKMH